MGKNISWKRYSVPRIIVSNWVNLISLSLLFYLPISIHECAALFLPMFIFFLRKLTACSTGSEVSARTHPGSAVQDCKCHVQEKGISQLGAWSHNQTSWETWGTGVSPRTVAAMRHCLHAPTGSLTNEIRVSWNQGEFGTGLHVKLRLLGVKLAPLQRGDCSWVTWQHVSNA